MSGIASPKSPINKPRPTPIVADSIAGLEIARGRVPGHSVLNKFGTNFAVPDSFRTVWDMGSEYPWPTVAQRYNMSSSTAVDSVSGSGAQVVRLYGLDAEYLEIDELLTLNGKTTVTTVLSYSRIHRGKVTRAGGDGVNIGDIYAYTGANTAGVPNSTASTVLKITANMGQTLMAVYTIPANKVGYMYSFYASSSAGKDATVQFRERPSGGAWNVKQHFDLVNASFEYMHQIPLKIEPKTDIEVRAALDALPAHAVSAGFDIVMVETKGEI